MNKRCGALIILYFLISGANAQNNEPGIRLGLNYTNIYGDLLPDKYEKIRKKHRVFQISMTFKPLVYLSEE